MADKAYKQPINNPNNIKKLVIRANKVTRKDEEECEFTCLDCGCKLYLIHREGSNYFSAKGSPHNIVTENGKQRKCKYDESSKKKKVPAGNRVLNLSAVLTAKYKDKDKDLHDCIDNHNNNNDAKDDTIEKPEIEEELDWDGDVVIKNVETIFNDIVDNDIFDTTEVMLDDSKEKTIVEYMELYVCEKNLDRLKLNNLEGVKFIISDKFHPNSDGLKTEKGSVWVKIGNSNDIKENVYVEIELLKTKDSNPKEFYELKNLFFNDGKTKDGKDVNKDSESDINRIDKKSNKKLKYIFLCRLEKIHNKDGLHLYKGYTRLDCFFVKEYDEIKDLFKK